MSAGLRSLLTRLEPAGVILFARNITSGEQSHKLLKECRACVSTPLFTCVDMEGGKVDRFRNVIGPAPSAAEVFASGDPKLYRKHGTIIGESCRTLGFNTDFAPVVDLAFEASRNVMSSRAVSDDPKEAVSYAREFLAGLRSKGVLGAIKHFPGSARRISTLTTNFRMSIKPGRSCGLRTSLPTARCGANLPWFWSAMRLIRR